MSNLKRHQAGIETVGVVIHRMAWLYDLGCSLVGMGTGFRRKTLQLARVRVGERVLDVGCGTGVLTRLAAEVVGDSGEVIGIDPSQEMIQVAKRRAEKVQSEAVFQLGVIESLPFEDESFDVVLSSMMLHHLPPELKVTGLKEIFRVLKSGGRLMVVDVDKPTGRTGRALMFFWHKGHVVKDNYQAGIPELIQNTGFINVHHPRSKWCGFIAFWLANRPG